MTSRAYLIDETLVEQALIDLGLMSEETETSALRSLRNVLASQQVIDLGAAHPGGLSDVDTGLDVVVRIGAVHFTPMRRPGEVAGGPPPASSWGHTDRTLVAAILQAALDNIHEANANDQVNR